MLDEGTAQKNTTRETHTSTGACLTHTSAGARLPSRAPLRCSPIELNWGFAQLLFLNVISVQSTKFDDEYSFTNTNHLEESSKT